MTKVKYGECKALAALALGILALYYLYTASSVSIVFRIVAVFPVLILSGIAIQRSMSFKGGWGLSLIGGKHGSGIIEKLSKMKGGFWEEFAMWGLTISLGLMTYFLVKGKIKKSTFIIGMVSLILLELFVLPYLAYGLQFINIPGFSISSPQQFVLPNLASLISLQSLAELGATIVFGFVGLIAFLVFYSSSTILYSFGGYLSNPTPAGAIASGISTQIPNVPIIPGITLPLLPGLIAIAIVLVCHEFAHGILARRAKVKIKQIGILLFGFIPIGGFVEPDEKQVMKLKPEQQTHIFSAGIAANFLLVIIFFALTIFFVIFVNPYANSYALVITSTTHGYPAYGVIPNGSIVTQWNGHPISNLTQLESAAALDTPNSIVSVGTTKGVYNIKAIADPANQSKGLIGVMLGYKVVQKTIWGKIAYFLFGVISLSMIINFFVAVLNLFPIVGLDGWRIWMSNIKTERNRKIVNIAGMLLLFLIVASFIPLAFHI